jgi:hypothetical protein
MIQNRALTYVGNIMNEEVENNKLLNSAKMVYEQVKNYDLHYSNIRTTVSTFLLTTALGLGSYLIGQGSDYYILGLFMPTAFLCISILNNLFFVYVMGKCAKKAGELELLISALSQNEGNIKVKIKPEIKVEAETKVLTIWGNIAYVLSQIVGTIGSILPRISGYIKREFFNKTKNIEVKNKVEIKVKYKSYTISEYLEKFEPLLFRNDFEQTIRGFKPFYKAPKSFFGEIGVKSTVAPASFCTQN